MLSSVRRRTHEILSGTRPSDWASAVVQWFIITLIVLNVAAVILATVDTLHNAYQHYYYAFELFSVAVFTIEYVLRVWSSIESERFRHPVKGRLRFMVTPGAIIDLLAILPFFVPRLTNVDLRAIRALRIFRLLRLLKLGRFSRSIDIFSDVLKNKKEQIAIAVLMVSILLVFASSFMYFAEHRAQPEAFSSIPQAMWWGIITLTTVGYGDVHPVTTLGKVLGGLIALMGIGLFALPAGILSSGFEEALERKKELDGEDEAGDEDEEESDRSAHGGDSAAEDGEARYCSHCGQRLPEEQS